MKSITPKKITTLVMLLATLALSGCFGIGEDAASTAQEVNNEIYKSNEFQIRVPSSWEVFQKRDFTSEVPQSTQIAIRSKRKNELFIANVTVTKNTLSQEMSAEDYGKKILQSQRIVLQNFEEIDIKTSNGGFTSMFQGKRNAGEPTIKFIQHTVVKDHTAFIATAAFITTEDDIVAQEAQDIAESLSAL